MSADEAAVHGALASPVRRRLIGLLGDAGAASVSTLSDALDRHPNTVRSHLAVLTRIGLVELDAGADDGHARGRGRPARRYRLAAGAPITGGEDLGGVLALLTDLGLDPRVDDADDDTLRLTIRRRS